MRARACAWPGTKSVWRRTRQACARPWLAAHADGGLTPPNLKDVLEELGVAPKAAAPVLRLLCESGELVKIQGGLYYHGPP